MPQQYRFIVDKVLSELRGAFPASTLMPDTAPLSFADFSDVGAHLQKDPARSHIDCPTVRATASSWCAVVAALAKEGAPGVDQWIYFELLFLCQHLELLAPGPRSIAYPFCLRAFVLSEARDEAQFGEGILYLYGLDELNRQSLSSPQEVAVLSAWCYLAELELNEARLARALTWLILINSKTEVQERHAKSIMACSAQLAQEQPHPFDLSLVRQLGTNDLKRWADEVVSWADILDEAMVSNLLKTMTAERVRDRIAHLLSIPQ